MTSPARVPFSYQRNLKLILKLKSVLIFWPDGSFHHSFTHRNIKSLTKGECFAKLRVGKENLTLEKNLSLGIMLEKDQTKTLIQLPALKSEMVDP